MIYILYTIYNMSNKKKYIYIYIYVHYVIYNIYNACKIYIYFI